MGIVVSLSAICQTWRHFTGTVKNTECQNVEYVTVEVKDMDIRTISDVNGNFSVSVPEDSSMKLVFRHVAYLPKTVDVKDVSDKSPLNVIMSSSAYTLPDVAVIGIKMKEKTLKHKGFPCPGGIVFKGRNNIGTEMGLAVNPKHDFLVKNFNLPVSKCTYSKCTLSINVYEIENEDSFVNILYKPIYAIIEKSQTKQSFDILPQERLVLMHDKRYYVSMEIVDTQSDGTIEFPAYFKGSYVRNANTCKIKKIPFYLGLSIKGLEFPGIGERSCSGKVNGYAPEYASK